MCDSLGMVVTQDQVHERVRAWPTRVVSGATAFLLVVSVLCEVWVLPAVVGRVGDTFPEVVPYQVPALIWGVVTISCGQAVLVLTLVALRLRRLGRRTHTLAGWISGFLLMILLLSVGALIALSQLGFTTPSVMLGLILMGVVALGAAVAVTVGSHA